MPDACPPTVASAFEGPWGMMFRVTAKWFTVRCVFRLGSLEELEDAEPHIYEERLTLWQAESLGGAIELAEQEAAEYVNVLDGRNQYLGLAQAYELPDPPTHGAEVFSLLRESTLDREAYLDAFFDTGTERQQRT